MQALCGKVRAFALQRQGTLSVRINARRLSAGPRLHSQGGGKIYEMRTYSVLPGRMREALQLVGDNLHLRTAYSKNIGFWTTEMGAMNELIGLWEYGTWYRKYLFG